jgi:hypothetical protein
MKLDVTKLISIAEDLINDEQIGLAAEITCPVQELIDQDGNSFVLSLSIKVTNSIGELINETNSKVKDDKSIEADFETKLYDLINNSVDKGLIKPNLINKMKYVLKSCELS